jgi:KUP system potassium uptake protein
MKLSFFPQIRVVHTSKTFHGQLYVPIVNIVMCIGTVLVASIYNNTTSLGNAYGTCVMFVTFFDTCMVSLVAMFVWRISPYIVVFPFLVFALMDGAFLSSALTKVPQGAWFTITLSAVLASFLLLWRFGKEQQWFAEAEDRFPTSHFVKQNKDGTMSLSDRYSGTTVSSFQGLGIFFDKAGETTPMVFSQFVLKLTAIPEVSIFFHLRPLETPSISPDDRFTVSRLAIPNCYRVVVRFGYNDIIVTPDLAAVIYNQVRQFLFSEADLKRVSSPEQVITTQNPDAADKDQVIEVTAPNKVIDGTEPNDAATPTHAPSEADASDHAIIDHDPVSVETLDRAYEHKVLYIIGKEQMKITKGTRLVRGFLLSVFLWVRDNTRGKMANLKVPADKLVEVGFLKEI